MRLVDCPGLVFPGYTQLELQVLAGILPIAQMPAIPSSIHYALQCLPLERIFELEHPSKKDPVAADKRTWREGMRRQQPSDAELPWTAMDVLTAFAEKKGWITAKAGRPDVNRAGNASEPVSSFSHLNAAKASDQYLGHWLKDGSSGGFFLLTSM